MKAISTLGEFSILATNVSNTYHAVIAEMYSVVKIKIFKKRNSNLLKCQKYKVNRRNRISRNYSFKAGTIRSKQ